MKNSVCKSVTFLGAEECLKQEALVNEEKYEVEGTTTNPCSNASKKSRRNKNSQVLSPMPSDVVWMYLGTAHYYF